MSYFSSRLVPSFAGRSGRAAGWRCVKVYRTKPERMKIRQAAIWHQPR
jgi:hypothetical protein